MPGFRSYKEIVRKAYEEGQYWTSSYIRNFRRDYGSVVPFEDLADTSGNPYAFMYPGNRLEATLMPLSTGIYTGGNVSPAKKYLHKLSIMSNQYSSSFWGSILILCDVLMYYPGIDMSEFTEGEEGTLLIHSLSSPVSLPRYTSGEGVRAYVIAQSPVSGNESIRIKYTNSLGQTDRYTTFAAMDTIPSVGQIVNSTELDSCFLPLAAGDRGIRSVQELHTTPDIMYGIVAIILVKPIATFRINRQDCAAEWDFLTMLPSLPEIKDGASLQFLFRPPDNLIKYNKLLGDVTFIWN